MLAGGLFVVGCSHGTDRQVAGVTPMEGGARVILNARKLWQVKEVRAASVDQGRRYAERWCAARLLDDLPTREAVAKLVEKTPPEPPQRTRAEIQQGRRLEEALRPPQI